MTIPEERLRSLKNARSLLFEIASGYKRPSRDLLTKAWDRSEFKRVPRNVREACRLVMRHYPFDFEIDLFWRETDSSLAIPRRSQDSKRVVTRRSQAHHEP